MHAFVRSMTAAGAGTRILSIRLWRGCGIILDSFYLADPCVAWFYVDYEADFYGYEYGQYFQQYPILHRPDSHTREFSSRRIRS